MDSVDHVITSREMLLAVPGDTVDIYRRHQQVWAGVAAHVRTGQDFLFRQESAHLFRIRSSALPRAREVVFRAGCAVLELVVSDRYDRNKEQDVPREQAAEWTARLVEANGFDVSAIAVLDYRIASGQKPSKEEQRGHRIRYAVAKVKLNLTIRDLASAQRAWQGGIGRGRRFGFGMLVCEQ